MKLFLIAALPAMIGLTACAPSPPTNAVCEALTVSVERLVRGLVANPATEPAVGAPAVDIVVIHQTGCN